MAYLFRPKVLATLALLLIVMLVVPLTVISIRLHATHAAAPRTMVQGKHSPRGNFTGTVPDWSEFRGDAARDGNQSANTLFSKANANSLVPVSGAAYTTTGESVTSPTVYQGILYYVANTLVTTPTKTLHVGTIYAVDTTTGQVLWSETTPTCGTSTKPGWGNSTPAVTTALVNGVSTTEVFLGWGTSSSGQTSCIYDLNGGTGAVIWAYKTRSPVVSSPAIMSTNGDSIVVMGDNGDLVHAFDVNYTGPMGGTGVQLWGYDTRSDTPPPSSAQYCKPAPELCGDAIWSSPAEGIVTVNGTPHHYAYFGLGAQANTVGRVDAIDLDTLVNNSPVLAWAFWDPNPLYDDDFGTVLTLTDASGNASRVYSGTNNGHMFSLDATTGSLYFDFNAAPMGIHSTGALVTIGGTTELIFGSGCAGPSFCKGFFGYIWALDALSTNTSGTVLWQSQNFNNDIVSSPIVANQDVNAVVYILGPWKSKSVARGDLLAIDPQTGNVLADYSVFNHVYGALSSPTIYGNEIFVTEGFSAYTGANPGQGGIAAFQCTC